MCRVPRGDSFDSDYRWEWCNDENGRLGWMRLLLLPHWIKRETRKYKRNATVTTDVRTPVRLQTRIVNCWAIAKTENLTRLPQSYVTLFIRYYAQQALFLSQNEKRNPPHSHLPSFSSKIKQPYLPTYLPNSTRKEEHG